MTEQQTFKRESAKRILAYEFRNVKFTQKFSGDEKAPTFILTPTGEVASRIFICGIMTEKEKAGDSQNVFYKSTVMDMTGKFFVSAGKYQPNAMMQIARIDTPAYVSISGKPKVYISPENKIFVSINAESVNVIDRDTYDMWLLETAKLTNERITAMEKGDNPIVNAIKEKYKTDLEPYKSMTQSVLVR